MPVYQRTGVVHLHIPKTAGTAIERQFHQIGDMAFGVHDFYGQLYRDGRWWELQHLSWSELRSLSDGGLDALRIFAVIRDPYQRLISDFLWRQVIGQAYPDSATAVFDTFDEFIDTIPDDIDTGWNTLIHGPSLDDAAQANLLIHTRPQHHYISRDGALDPEIRLVRFEDLRAQLAPLFAMWNVPLATIRDSTERRLEDFITPATLARVNRLYHRDFEVLGYPMVDRLGA